MVASLAPSPLISQQDTTGSPLVGGLLFTYLTGSNTPTPTYTDATGVVANTNPIALNDYGQAQVWLSAAVTYRFVMALPGDGDSVTPPTDPIWTVDNISVSSGVTSIGGIGGAITLGAGLSILGQQLSATIYRGYLDGLVLSTAGNSVTFGVAAGIAVDSTNVAIMPLTVSLNKTTSAWGAGTGNGSLDTGSVAASTWYHAFLIQRPDTGGCDILTSLSPSAPTLPALYTLFRRIGSMLTDSSKNWKQFTQQGDQFLWAVPPVDVNSTITTTTPALAGPLSVPSGIVVEAIMAFNTSIGNGSTNYGTLSSVATGGLTASVNTAQTAWSPTLGTVGQAVVRAFTNTARQVYAAVSSASSTTYQIASYGWFDTRGKNA